MRIPQLPSKGFGETLTGGGGVEKGGGERIRGTGPTGEWRTTTSSNSRPSRVHRILPASPSTGQGTLVRGHIGTPSRKMPATPPPQPRPKSLARLVPQQARERRTSPASTVTWANILVSPETPGIPRLPLRRQTTPWSAKCRKSNPGVYLHAERMGMRSGRSVLCCPVNRVETIVKRIAGGGRSIRTR